MNVDESAVPSTCCASTSSAGGNHALRATALEIGGPFTLLDHHGRRVSDTSFGDRCMLMFFGFTHCERVCPRQLTKLSTVLDELGPLAEHLQALYISVDPARDTPAVMRGFLAARFPRFLGLTGTAAQIDALRARFRVYAAPATDGLAPDGYVVAHTAFAYLVQRGGRCIAHFSDALEAGTITTSLRNHLAQRAAVTGLAL